MSSTTEIVLLYFANYDAAAAFTEAGVGPVTKAAYVLVPFWDPCKGIFCLVKARCLKLSFFISWLVDGIYNKEGWVRITFPSIFLTPLIFLQLQILKLKPSCRNTLSEQIHFADSLIFR